MHTNIEEMINDRDDKNQPYQPDMMLFYGELYNNIKFRLQNESGRAAGPAYYALHPQKGITIFVFLTYQAFKTGKESFLRQILLGDLRLYTYEWKQTKIWMTFKLKS